MMRRVSFILAALMLASSLMGCGDNNGGGGGTAGSGGMGGTGGTGGNGVACVDNVCPCTEAGIRAAIAEGGGPFTFTCDGPTTVVTEAEIIINNDVILDGEGKLIVDGNGMHRVFNVGIVETELRRVTVTGGIEKRLGGGIQNRGVLTLIDSTVSGNSTTYGSGGIVNLGTMTLISSTVSGNSTTSAGGGIGNPRTGKLTLVSSVVSDNSATYGGGISNHGVLTLIDSTVSSNNATEDGGGISMGNPAGATGEETDVTLINSTVSRNAADGDGGGVWTRSGTLTVTNSTVSANSATLRGGGIFIFRGDAYTRLTNATLTGNTAGLGGSVVISDDRGIGTATLRNSLVDGDCDGDALASGGSNIESPGDTCGFGQATDQVNVTAEQLALGPLQDNGGPTMTHALGAGSVAIDQIPEAECVDADGARLTTDQRSEPRPDGPKCDVGAFEVQP